MHAIDAGSASVSSVNNVQQCMVPPFVHVYASSACSQLECV
jgi:hypothetical protein